MTSMQKQQLRKVAVLVATLEPEMAERLLGELPTTEAQAVRAVVEALEEIDASELQDVLDEFRSGLAPQVAQPTPPVAATTVTKAQTTKQTQFDGIEIDQSLLDRMSAAADAYDAQEAQAADSPWQALSQADVATLVDFLTAEQPQTIAIVLSRLKSEQAAELISQLAPSLQTEVLARLADLDPADEQTLHVVASQLAEWIDQQRQRQQRLAAGRDLVQNILEKIPYTQRTALLTRMRKQHVSLATELTTRKPTQRSIVSQPIHQPLPTKRVTDTVSPVMADNPLADLEAMDDRTLLNALRHTDRQTAMLALAGASELLMKRIVRGLPRKQANQFRQQVRAVGPAKLSDMEAAQRELVRCGQ